MQDPKRDKWKSVQLWRAVHTSQVHQTNSKLAIINSNRSFNNPGKTKLSVAEFKEE